jgi:Zn-dependent protease with chaperone function
MTEAVDVLKFVALAPIFFGIIGSGVCTIAYPLLRGRLAALAPVIRARTLVAWSMAPCLMALTFTGFCFLPLLLNLLGWSPAQCSQDSLSHPHFCSGHPHLLLDDRLAWGAFALGGGLMLFAAVAQLYRWLDARRALSALAITSRYDASRGVHIVASHVPFALTAGLWRPEIYLSLRLVASLPADMLEVVIAHEQAHARRRDGLRQLLAGLLSLMHLPWIRRRLLADLALACEEACDEVAARHVGDRLHVAHTLLTVARLFSGALPGQALAASFADGHVVERVESLLADHANRPYSRRPQYLILTLGLIAVIWAAEPLHHLTEILLRLLAR